MSNIHKDDRVYVGHMVDMIRKALAMAAGKSREDYDGDEVLRLALTHLLQVIGEAASHVSKTFRVAHSDVPWNAIVGMRHKVVHDYMDVDQDIVWDTVKTELELLLKKLEALG